jgi:hypothetical protein
LFHRLNREEAEKYLENRRQKRFTVIQAVALAELDGIRTPNAYGDRPLIQEDPVRPAVTPGSDLSDSAAYDYWDHVDWIVNKAAEKGIFIGLLPTWGDKVVGIWGQGPVVFNEKNARTYGEFIGGRFADRPNIIWILGGDRPPENEGKDYRPVWRGRGHPLQGHPAPHDLPLLGREQLFEMASRRDVARFQHDPDRPPHQGDAQLRLGGRRLRTRSA